MSLDLHKYLHFASAVERINIRYRLTDDKLIKILQSILLAYTQGAPIQVLDVLLLRHIASTATLHSSLKGLIALKLIKAEACPKDARRKYLTPTKLGISWLEECTALLCSAHKTNLTLKNNKV